MPAAMHTITVDPASGILEVKIRGFWSMADFDAFAVDIRDSVATVARTGKQQSVLYDYTDAKIQSQEVIAALQRLASNNAFKSRKVACFTDGKMAMTQARRIAAAGQQIEVFADRESAMEWIQAA